MRAKKNRPQAAARSQDLTAQQLVEVIDGLAAGPAPTNTALVRRQQHGKSRAAQLGDGRDRPRNQKKFAPVPNAVWAVDVDDPIAVEDEGFVCQFASSSQSWRLAMTLFASIFEKA